MRRKVKRFNFSVASAVAALLTASPAFAQDHPLKVSGFGTLAVTSMNSDQGDFAGSFADVPNGVGRSASLSAAPDSRLAVQADLTLSNQLEAVIQVMSRHTRFDNYAPSLEMLNLKYNFDTRTSLRIGRIAHPFFMASDTRQIGFAQTFARGPIEVYGQSQITASDVIQASHRQSFSSGNLLASVGFGRAQYGNPASDPSIANEDAGALEQVSFADLLWESGALQLRFGYTTGKNDFSVGKLNNLIKVATSINPSLTDELSFKDKQVSFTGLGFTYDPGSFVVQGEYTMTRWGLGSKSIAPDANAYYLMGGSRIGAWTPYAIYAKRTTESPRVVQEFPSPQLNAAFSAIALSSAPAQHTLSAGIRYDFKPGFALKLQLDSVTQDAANGYLTNINPANPPLKDSRYDVVGLNLDFIF